MSLNPLVVPTNHCIKRFTQRFLLKPMEIHGAIAFARVATEDEVLMIRMTARRAPYILSISKEMESVHYLINEELWAAFVMREENGTKVALTCFECLYLKPKPPQPKQQPQPTTEALNIHPASKKKRKRRSEIAKEYIECDNLYFDEFLLRAYERGYIVVHSSHVGLPLELRRMSDDEMKLMRLKDGAIVCRPNEKREWRSVLTSGKGSYKVMTKTEFKKKLEATANV